MVQETEEDRRLNPQPRWHWTELRVGEYISIYNRDFLLMDADAFTRDWFEQHSLTLPQALQLPEKVLLVYAALSY